MDWVFRTTPFQSTGGQRPYGLGLVFLIGSVTGFAIIARIGVILSGHTIVITVAAGQAVGAEAPINIIAAGATVNRVIASFPGYRVMAWTSGNMVIARAAD